MAEELRQELAAAKAAREALDAREARAADRERVAYLRQMGALATLADQHLLALAPSVDASTSEGREALQAWTDQNAGLFQSRTPTQVEVEQSLAQKLPTSSNGVFGEELHRKVIASVFGGRSRS